MARLVRLSPQLVAKPWGRTDLPACFKGGADRIGEVWFDDPDQALPILVKWLFTSERLSIQVHPNDAQARSLGLSAGKEECWIVTHASPGATLGIGTRHALTAAELHEAALSGALETLMDWHPVQAGDWFHIPPGTVHAIGAGITLVEIQQNADITYRLYDYGRPRDLHLEDGIPVSQAAPYSDKRHGKLQPPRDLQRLTQCAHFEIFHGAKDRFLGLEQADAWLIPLQGSIGYGDARAARGDVLYGALEEAGTPSADFEFLLARTSVKRAQ